VASFGDFPFTRWNSATIIPELPALTLSDAERETLAWLENRAQQYRYLMEVTDAYYRGEQLIRSLGIAIPPELTQLRTIVGWPAKAVDPYVDRLYVDGFRLANATDSDMDLRDLWVANGMDGEQSLAFTDALAMGRGYITVGSPDEQGDAPRMCVESPLNMAVQWDSRTNRPKAALQTYWEGDAKHAALYLPEQTIQLATDVKGNWEITDRDEHGFGWVPVIRLANRPRSGERDGRSEITPSVRSLTDLACRTLLNLTVASELYSVPQKVILGASEDDFVKADGTPKSGWDTYITKVLGLERDDNGELPQVHQFQTYDPSVYTKVLDWTAAAMASEVNATPQDMGLYTQGNPPSADSVRFAEGSRDRRAVKMQGIFQPELVRAIQMGIRFQNGGDLPAQFRRIEVDWADVSTAQPAATADQLFKLASMGSIPATSDVTLKRAGFSSVERARLEQDRKLDAGASILAELANSLEAKQARADTTVAKDIAPTATPPAVKPAPPANG
jgi:hypothetical protein